MNKPNYSDYIAGLVGVAGALRAEIHATENTKDATNGMIALGAPATITWAVEGIKAHVAELTRQKENAEYLLRQKLQEEAKWEDARRE